MAHRQQRTFDIRTWPAVRARRDTTGHVSLVRLEGIEPPHPVPETQKESGLNHAGDMPNWRGVFPRRVVPSSGKTGAPDSATAEPCLAKGEPLLYDDTDQLASHV
ncbi:hypothetical protein GCM10010885_10520 [Alicyclobacillus cellulosilyticus]|uniref:Uncharacterized protein n=1 Tax=Alicyclobacillus cellulosilyticus TaxID=1003997 RepID=A0A917K9D0_9BACL|nr:hypothetical protein GCM10010885_10520 [Alicyclobacillus cellulosilyticus]